MAFELIRFKARTLEADVLKIGKPLGEMNFSFLLLVLRCHKF